MNFAEGKSEGNFMQFQLTTHGIIAVATALASDTSVQVMYFRPFNSVSNTYVDSAIPTTSLVVVDSNTAQISMTLDQTHGNYAVDSFDLFLTSVDAANSTPTTRDSNAFACSYIAGSSIYQALTTPLQKYNNSTTTPNSITVIAEFQGTNLGNALSFTVVIPSTQISAAMEVSSVDNLVQPSAVNIASNIGSNLVLCGVDDTGTRVLAKLSESLNLYSFDNYTPTVTGTNLSLGAGSSNLSTLNFDSTFAASVVAGRYIIQITSGVAKGVCRNVVSASSSPTVTTLTLSTPITQTLVGNETFIIYNSIPSYISNINTKLNQTITNLNNAESMLVYTVPAVDYLPVPLTGTVLSPSGTQVVPQLVLIGSNTSTVATDGIDAVGNRMLAKNGYVGQTPPRWSFDNYLVGTNDNLNNYTISSVGTPGATQNLFTTQTLNFAAAFNQYPASSPYWYLIQFVSGTAANIGQVRRVSAVNGAIGSSYLTVVTEVPFPATPQSGDVFELLSSSDAYMANFSNWLSSNESMYNSILSQQSSLATGIANLTTLTTTSNQQTAQAVAYLTNFSNNSANLVINAPGFSQETLVTQTHQPLQVMPTGNISPGNPSGVYANTANFTTGGFNVSKPLLVTVTAGGTNGTSTVRAYVSPSNANNQSVSNFVEVAYATQTTSGGDISFVAFCVPPNGAYFVLVPNSSAVLLWNEFIMD